MARVTNCKPMGKPVEENPHGSEIAGRPVRLKGAVKRVNRPAASTAEVPSISGATVGVVGSISRSYFSKNRSKRRRELDLQAARQSIFAGRHRCASL